MTRRTNGVYCGLSFEIEFRQSTPDILRDMAKHLCTTTIDFSMGVASHEDDNHTDQAHDQIPNPPSEARNNGTYDAEETSHLTSRQQEIDRPSIVFSYNDRLVLA